MFGFYRVAAVTPRTKVADVSANLSEHLTIYRRMVETGVALAVFPELSLTGATCGDLFRQEVLLRAAWSAARELAAATEETIAVFGLPLLCPGGIFNVAAVAARGSLLALIPVRSAVGCFRSGAGVSSTYAGIPLVDGAVFDCGFRFAVEPGEDCLLPDSGLAALRGGAAVVALPVAMPKIPGRDIGNIISALSGRIGAVYVAAASGRGESSTDFVFSGDSRIADRGNVVAASAGFAPVREELYFDADIEAVLHSRSSARFAAFGSVAAAREIPAAPESPDISFAHNPAAPFLPERNRERFYSDVLDIQTAGLVRRVEHTGARSLVIGVSGGLDSTLALVVMDRCREMMSLPREAIRAFTLPGFGTSGRTHDNALALCHALKVDLKEVDITGVCRRHFEDLGHDGRADAVFENAQARERTQILMDAANMYNGLLVGTGDLSELALGWCTYNGDQMSMYSVNGAVPKTLIPMLLEYEAGRRGNKELTKVIRDIIGTPISPELLPLAENGILAQKTEEVVGPYELHDFFLYHVLGSGAGPEKIAYLAAAAFAGRYQPEEIAKWLRVFGRRFISQQFKRSAMPDGPAAGVFSLSPRGAWSMPSDASFELWTNW